MDEEKRKSLTIVYAHRALNQLDEIWEWIHQRYGSDHADRYIKFLERHVNALADDYRRGKHVSTNPKLRYILIRRKSRGHGHVAVYRVGAQRLDVLHVFHSAQDWEATLSEDV